MMKNKWVILGVLLLVLGLMTSHKAEPESKVYPLAMGFDWSESGYEVYYDIPDLSTYTGEGKPMDMGERVWHFIGNDKVEIEKQMERSKKETPDMGHVQVILLGAELLKNSEKYGQVLLSFVNNPVMGSGSYVFVCDKISSVFMTGAKKTDSLGRYLVELTDKMSKEKLVVLQDLYNAYYNQENMPVMINVSTNGEEVFLEEMI